MMSPGCRPALSAGEPGRTPRTTAPLVPSGAFSCDDSNAETSQLQVKVAIQSAEGIAGGDPIDESAAAEGAPAAQPAGAA